MSFPPATEMFQFAGFASILLRGSIPLARWVAPFGDLRITGCSPLPEAFRRVPRPSSPLGAKASTKCPSHSLENSFPIPMRRHTGPGTGNQKTGTRNQERNVGCVGIRSCEHTHGRRCRRQETGTRRQEATRFPNIRPRSPSGHRRPFLTDRQSTPRPPPRERTGASPVAETLFTFARTRRQGTGTRSQDKSRSRRSVPCLQITKPINSRSDRPNHLPVSWLLSPWLLTWWSRSESNRRPPECKSGALPTELRPLSGDRRQETGDRGRRGCRRIPFSVSCLLFPVA
jgi:hypothetical protein